MLYLIKSHDKLKIGYTKDIAKRLKQYKTHNLDIELISYRHGTMQDEKAIQDLCTDYKIDLEWYKCCDIVMNIFSSYQNDAVKEKIENLERRLSIQQDNYNNLLSKFMDLKSVVDKRVNEMDRILTIVEDVMSLCEKQSLISDLTNANL